MADTFVKTTLKKKDKYLYPTTYYDQIILSNGERWDGKVVVTFEDLTEEQKESLKGYTPIKGVDYYTEEEQQEIIDTILASLPYASGVNF